MNPDDIDLLFSRLEAAVPPAGMEARILARVARAERRRALARRLWSAIDVAAVLLLALIGYRLGQQLATGGALDFASVLIGDWSAFGEAPALYLSALLPAVPWAEVSAILLNLTFIGIVSYLALRPAGRRAAQPI